ncbi:MAG: NADH:ubiquinone reductase (Na(+)-transporting) subunit C [Bacteroidales bacterium]|jgi:Na+-transporting NADH:ubiquinone oxidoreductase subunit C|nr:NADH:ubiquinone reductase (Na(+)-transporting) subunit C [Bacteroidales bacterium]NCU35590.1 NADH:ubiquinone reductase (Na(+)-transporting) subunit C [Candidatus Falkowbacteria bacterium]MDD2632982.1 NADH:ubiquinone reductase (Na(+)-transporting) subunit C [Bacteroidales bacterium]MDD3130955.1 NADH:ubiquinone reductase (Na(+)-transporting) subunit C [Bacteroidales bacterium]MDD3526274.1 NADH:ubiquinone reductase (Na(+)-transporting) subunit C [Bacteroidales bacterium]
MFSNKYIFTYASVMVILVAAILSSASMLLKPYQEANVKAEKIQGILASANVTTDREHAANTYQQHIVEELAVDSEGNVVSRYRNDSLIEGDVRPFDIDIKEALMRNQAIKLGESAEAPLWPVFVLEKDDEKYYIVPVRGVGLWGPIWGNIAFESDFNTIAGATFDHKGETPGLGAEINTSWFEDEFKGKTIFDEQGKFVSVNVVKGGAGENAPHAVDAISGGTITSNGVKDMLLTGLDNYVPYIKKNNNNE